MSRTVLDTVLDTDFGGAFARRDAGDAPTIPPQARRIEDAAARAAGLDRARTLRFQWEGKTYHGYSGDTLSAALLANGVDVLARSFKYHRPRGVTSAGQEEAGAIVTVGEGARRTPNTNASTLELYDGLVAEGQNAWPSVRFDLGAVNTLASPFLGAGFYYKTFFSFLPFNLPGTRQWMIFEAMIRKAAGMGRASHAPDPDAYETAHGFCDVLVVGSGPAGLEAARSLGEAGLDVWLVEQDFEFGGRLLQDGEPVEGADAESWRRGRLESLDQAGVRRMARTSVFGLYDGGVAGLVEQVYPAGRAPGRDEVRERVWILRPKHIVLATGAIERGLAFGDNDRPGVMSAGAVRGYLNRHGVLAGRRIAVATTNDSGYLGLERLRAAGADVTVLDARLNGSARRASGASGVAHRAGVAPLRTLGALDPRRARIEGVELARAQGAGWGPSQERLECDLLAVAGGWSPTLHLACHRGVKPVWDPERAAFVADRTVEAIEICGAAAGLTDADHCAASGRNAAARILGRAEEPAPAETREPKPPRALFEVRILNRPVKSFIDPLHDVTTGDVRRAEGEGYVSVEHLKRYTTLGMAPDQGKAGNVIGLGVLADAQGRDMSAVGATRFRPPYAPVSIGALAGRRRDAQFRAARRTPMHAWHLRQGAVMTNAGAWVRPWYYPQAGERLEDAYVREMRAVRETVGLCDVSTLGKIAVQGPDAAEFLDRVYVNGFKRLKVGRARYGVMLRDDGIVFDDGTAWRFGEEDFFVTTTTTGAGAVMKRLEELLATRWPELRVTLASVSDAWAGFAVAGPRSLSVLQSIAPELGLDDDSLPFMGVVEGRIGGAPARIARISFSGERAYEVYVEAEHGVALAEALWDAAEPLGGVLYGTEALGGLRIEKGHVAGPELDGRTTLDDLGLGKMASLKKGYIGAALSRRPALLDPMRLQLVGLVATDGEGVFKAGSVVCDPSAYAAGAPSHGIGRVTSVTHSPALGRWIGLGLVKGGLGAWRDLDLIAADPVRGAKTLVRVVSPHLFDPEGARLKMATPEADAEATTRPAPEALARRAPLGGVWGAEAPKVFGRADGLEDPEAPGREARDRAAWIVEGRAETVWRVFAWPGAERAVADRLVEAVEAEERPGFGRRVVGAGGARLLRVGPSCWWVVGLAAARMDALRGAIADQAACAEIGAGLARFRVGGPAASDVLNRLAAIDLRPQSFATGAVAMTGAHGASFTLLRLAPHVFDLWSPRSSAGHLWTHLEETARQF